MQEFMAQNGGVVGTVVMVAVLLNFILSGLSKAIEVIKDKTTTQADNKAFEIINKIAAVLQKVIDWTSANRSHK